MCFIVITTSQTSIESCIPLWEGQSHWCQLIFFSIAMTRRKKAKSKVSFPYPVCKQKPEVKPLPSGLPPNCSSRWTHLLQLMALRFPRSWPGVMVRASSPWERLQKRSGLKCSVESHWWGADLVHHWQLFHMCVFRRRQDWIWMEHRHQRGYQKSGFQFPRGPLWLP